MKTVVDAAVLDEKEYYKALRAELKKLARRVGTKNVAYRFLCDHAKYAGKARQRVIETLEGYPDEAEMADRAYEYKKSKGE